MAGIIAFENPDPGEEGHFNWHWQGIEDPITFEQWLDITKPSTEQAGLANGNSVGQLLGDSGAGDIQNKTQGGADVANVENSVLTRAFVFGEDVSVASFRNITWHWFISGANFETELPENELRYIGVRTENNNFGWIAVIREESDLRPTAWAYETEPGVPINAGQVPVGGTAPILGLGLLFRRSRKRGR